MKHNLDKRMMENMEPRTQTPFDLQRISGPKSRKVQRIVGMPPDSMMAVYKDRFTYTFILERDVASIHFDRNRGEIFYKGHNIHNMEVSEEQRKVLKGVLAVLSEDDRGRPFLADYAATLERSFADKEK